MHWITILFIVDFFNDARVFTAPIENVNNIDIEIDGKIKLNNLL